MKILTNYDFTLNEIQNVSLQKLASSPQDPVKGQVYFNTALSRAYYFNGSSWVGMDSAGATMTGENIIDEINSETTKTIQDNRLTIDLGSRIGSSVEKTTAVDDDLLLLSDSADEGEAKKFLWSSLKSTLKAYFDSLYNLYTHPAGDGNLHVPATGTTNNGKVLKAGPTAGSIAWADDVDTTYSAGNGLTLNGTEFSLTSPSINLTPTSTNTSSQTGHTHAIESEIDLSISASEGKFPTAKAVKDYADGLLAANDAMLFKGTVGTGGTYTIANFNSLVAYNVGWTFKVITAGTIKGQVCEIGDMLIAKSSTGTDGDWAVVQANIDGAVTGPISATDGSFPLFNGSSGKIIKNSTFSPSSFATSIHDHTGVHTKKIVATLGGSTSQVVQHNLGTRDLVVTIRKTDSPYSQVITDVEFTSINTLTVLFALAPSANEYTITIVG